MIRYWRPDVDVRAVRFTRVLITLAVPQFAFPSSNADSSFWTTNAGAPVFNNDESLTVGPRGPVVLEDYHLVEKLAQFDRERIPERVVHAVGATAKGYFEVTDDVTDLTFADFLSSVGKKTDVLVRFSTVIPSRGQSQTIRDPRGFAVKFYTNEGNYDLVGNNMPVFFIRDGIKFPDMVHSFKPNPRTNLVENWRFVDFFSHHPESLHMFAHVFDDIGIPKDFRHMDGFGVHTFKWLTRDGKETFIKYHWKSKQGVESLMDDEAEAIGGADNVHATADLVKSIDAGDFPEWTLFVQTMDPAKASYLDFDPLDVTKTWPESEFPLRRVGRMVLNKNIDNFFNENEQAAFSPALVVPGITYSEDKLLQSRIFSYSDTQRYRVGPNYLTLPVNAPKAMHHNNHHDGPMNFVQRDGEINYFPSRFDPAVNAEKYPLSRESVCGIRQKTRIPKENNFAQPGELYRSWNPERRERFAMRIADNFLLQPRVTPELQRIWIDFWSQADEELGAKLKEKVNAVAGGETVVLNSP
ncbi:hypothetical protein BSKO_12113 [Bryopsis sp. KO-2023]|nr:hypothetical protein BSKO_12113 [Bryopsis sp. KO-2023]